MRIQYYSKTSKKKAFFSSHKLHYIIDPAIKTAVRRLTNKNTIDENDIGALESLGHTFQRVKKPLY